MASSRKKPRFDGEPEDNDSLATLRTPIGMLSDDILFCIFSISGPVATLPSKKKFARSHSLSQEDHGALTTIRYVSQVCHEWRRLLLSSPTIWANSLDIDELNQRTDEWRSEVMGRTGNAPISLRLKEGGNYTADNHAVPFVVDVLRREWGRIRSLFISTEEEKVVAQMLVSMVKPAPGLEYFHFWTHMLGKRGHFLLVEGGMLFSNNSPKLTCIHGGAKAFLNFQVAPGAVSNVVSLSLYEGFFSSFSIPKLYRALQCLPVLEELKIGYMTLSGSCTPLGARISLPRLRHIAIYVSYSSTHHLITNLLGHIVPAKGCRLITGRGELDNLQNEDLAITSHYHAAFITNVADFRQVQSLSLSYTAGAGLGFRASILPRIDSNYPRDSLPFTLAFNYLHHRRDTSILEWFSIPIIKAIASHTDFGCVTELELTLDETLISTCRLDLQTFFGSLISVTELIASVTTVQILMEIQTTAGFVLLPSTAHFSLYGKPFEFTKVEMADFLDARLNSGIPVKVLNLDLLKQHYSYSQDPQWEIFEQYDGLSVTWRSYTFEDECDYDES